VAAAGNYAADTDRIIESAIAVEQAQAKTTVRKITATITPGTPRLTARH